MAFNRTDTRQRAYNKIDACQPHGNWVDERSYNKTSKGCLMGNWFEESILRDSLGKEPTVHKVVVGERTVRGKGGFQSTSFLVSPDLDPSVEGHFNSTSRENYTAANADVMRFKPERFGERRRRQVDEVIDTAKRNMPQPQPHQSSYSTSYKEATCMATTKAIPLGSMGYVAREGANFNASLTSVNAVEATGPVDALDYSADQPITLYSGNPNTGTKMSVPGSTAGTGGSSHARNCNFSTPIGQHPIGGKHKTPQF